MAIIFFEKKTRRVTKDCDAVNCAVTKCGTNDDGSSRWAFRIVMRNEIAARITKTGYCMVGYDDETCRLYFKESDSKGYKLCGKNASSCTIKMQVDSADAFSEFRDNIAMQFDNVNMMYYIQGKPKEVFF